MENDIVDGIDVEFDDDAGARDSAVMLQMFKESGWFNYALFCRGFLIAANCHGQQAVEAVARLSAQDRDLAWLAQTQPDKKGAH